MAKPTGEAIVSTAAHSFHKALVESRPKAAGRSLNDTVDELIAEGLGIELRLHEPDGEPFRPETLERLREQLQAARSVTSHTSYYDWEPERLRGDIRLSADLGATIVMVHPSRFGMESPEPDFAGVRRLCAEARDLGVTVALENVPSGLPTLRRALDKVGSDPAATGLGICIDTGHANLSCALDGVEPRRFFDELRETIVEVHLHDNNGQEDQHLPPGDGTLDWAPLLAALRTLRPTTVFCLEYAWAEDPWGGLRKGREFLRRALA